MPNTVKGKLVDGLEYRGEKQFDFEMGEVQTAGAFFDAEIASKGADNELAFAGALMAGQLLSVGTCEGPFTIEQIKKLSVKDWVVLRRAQNSLNEEAAEDPNEQIPDEKSGR